MEREVVMVGGVKVEKGSNVEKMLRLNEEGKTVGEIAKLLGLKYQVVYNSLKMKGVGVNLKEKGESKSEKIRKMAKEGVSKGDIAKELGISYQFVYNVLSRK